MSADRSAAVTDEFKAAALNDAVDGLRERHPLASAAVAFVPWQRNLALAVAALVVGCAVFFPIGTFTVLIAVCTLAYVATMIDRLIIFARGSTGRPSSPSPTRTPGRFRTTNCPPTRSSCPRTTRPR